MADILAVEVDKPNWF